MEKKTIEVIVADPAGNVTFFVNSEIERKNYVEAEEKVISQQTESSCKKVQFKCSKCNKTKTETVHDNIINQQAIEDSTASVLKQAKAIERIKNIGK